jgi:sialic acid synthase SpsE
MPPEGTGDDIRMKGRVRLVAEVGSNFDGLLETALNYVTAARVAGADAVKFQTLRKDKLVAPRVRKNGDLLPNPVYRDFSNLDLPDEWHGILKAKADEEGIEFFSTPFHLGAVEVLEGIGVETYKIASGDITFFPLLQRVGSTGKDVVLSTGASSLGEVERAVEVLREAGARSITLLHCVTSYPPDWGEMNLRAIPTMSQRFCLPVGISDHSPGSLVPVGAVALGATMVEKHVTFDRARPGPDHPFAMTMAEFAEMHTAVRHIEEALGSGEKVPSARERAHQGAIRRGVYDPRTLSPAAGAEGVWLRPEHGSPHSS